MKAKFEITITYSDGEVSTFERESVCDNFYVAMENDLIDIYGIINSEDCIEYDYVKLTN